MSGQLGQVSAAASVAYTATAQELYKTAWPCLLGVPGPLWEVEEVLTWRSVGCSWISLSLHCYLRVVMAGSATE